MKSKTTAVIVGASSGLGRALAEYLALINHDLVLCARSIEDLEVMAKHLELIYGISVTPVLLDLKKVDETEAVRLIKSWNLTHNKIDQFYFTAGVINENDYGYSSIQCLDQMMSINFNGIIKLVASIVNTHFAHPIHICVVSSIATIRPRGSNIAYASSKKALEFYLGGLQHFLQDKNFHIQIVRLGYLRTAMTRGKKLLFPISDPMKSAIKLYKLKRKKKRLVYHPGFWIYIAWILYMVPWILYKKLNF